MPAINPNQFPKNSLLYAVACGDASSLNSGVLTSENMTSSYKCSESHLPLTLIEIATFNGHTQTVLALINHGARIDGIEDGTQPTPLHAAAIIGHTQILTALLNNGALINQIDRNGYTALHRAARSGHREIVRLLIERGADFTLLSSSGDTAYQMAAQRNHLETANIIRHAKKLYLFIDDILDALPASKQITFTEFGLNRLKNNLFKLLIKKLDLSQLDYFDSNQNAHKALAIKCAQQLSHDQVLSDQIFDSILDEEPRSQQEKASTANLEQKDNESEVQQSQEQGLDRAQESMSSSRFPHLIRAPFNLRNALFDLNEKVNRDSLNPHSSPMNRLRDLFIQDLREQEDQANPRVSENQSASPNEEPRQVFEQLEATESEEAHEVRSPQDTHPESVENKTTLLDKTDSSPSEPNIAQTLKRDRDTSDHEQTNKRPTKKIKKEQNSPQVSQKSPTPVLGKKDSEGKPLIEQPSSLQTEASIKLPLKRKREEDDAEHMNPSTAKKAKKDLSAPPAARGSLKRHRRSDDIHTHAATRIRPTKRSKRRESLEPIDIEELGRSFTQTLTLSPVPTSASSHQNRSESLGSHAVNTLTSSKKQSHKHKNS